MSGRWLWYAASRSAGSSQDGSGNCNKDAALLSIFAVTGDYRLNGGNGR
jgi:hypothetical protein